MADEPEARNSLTGVESRDDLLRHLAVHGPARNDAERDELLSVFSDKPDQPQTVTVAEQKAAGVPPEETVTVAEQKAGAPVPDPSNQPGGSK